MNELPSDQLEVVASGERRMLRASFEELKERLHENLDVERQVGEHALLISAIAGLTAATLGYGIAGMFSRR